MISIRSDMLLMKREEQYIIMEKVMKISFSNRLRIVVVMSGSCLSSHVLAMTVQKSFPFFRLKENVADSWPLL